MYGLLKRFSVSSFLSHYSLQRWILNVLPRRRSRVFVDFDEVSIVQVEQVDFPLLNWIYVQNRPHHQRRHFHHRKSVQPRLLIQPWNKLSRIE